MGSENPAFDAVIRYEDAYVQPLILEALKNQLPESAYKLISDPAEHKESGRRTLHITSYESLDFEEALRDEDCLINAYIIRKALIRKHFLSTTISNWIVKHPDSILKSHFKPAVEFELDYAEFLDDALIEAYELRESFQHNEGKKPDQREWWILKPSMSDRGQGIRLFSTEEELTSIFEDWESENPDSDDGASPSDDGASPSDDDGAHTGIMTSQLRHFIAQPYIHPPLLLPGTDNRKFHVRTYVVAASALRVYVYRPMLALFAAATYSSPGTSAAAPSLRAHLTNTCLQGGSEREGSVRSFWDLVDTLPSGGESADAWRDAAFTAICAATAEVFEAAARGMMVHFQPLHNAFEVFGLDFLVDARGVPWLLEVNAFPDFRQTGSELKGLVTGLWEGVVDEVVRPFFGVPRREGASADGNLVKVLDIDLGRR